VTRSLAIRLIYVVCPTGATGNHALVLLRHGLSWDYGGAPVESAAFWTSLTLLDPLAAILLLARPNFGVGMTAAIIVADVSHNFWIRVHYAPAGTNLTRLFCDPFLLSQLAFLIVVMATLRYAQVNSPRQSD